MQLSLQPQPLTRLNVTKHDRIWNKETSDGFYGLNILTTTLFSPPLKHITPEIIGELWERFDPLDLLIDSASDRSGSSSDTMIMMTTEEERKNEESIKNSYLAFELRKNLKDSHSQEYGLRSRNQGNYKQGAGEFPNGSDYDVNVDEGYGTDSRTNTTASLASPLSSSLSSLLTSESSSSQGSLKRNVNRNMNSNSKPQLIQANGRLVVGNKPNMVVKKKAQPVEKSDNSLMERLRALTTIQEEESSIGNVDPEWNNIIKNVPNSCSAKYSRDQYYNGIQDGSGCVREGVFRAKPIQVSSNVENHRISNGNTNSWNGLNTSSEPCFSEVSDSVVRGNGQFGDNHIDNRRRIPSNNSQRCVGLESRQKSHMYSTPNLNTRFDQPANQYENGVDISHVEMRHKQPGKRISGLRPQRYSWDYSDSHSVKGKFTDLDNRNLSERIPEPPKLTNQIRASSEMSLKSGRPLFASSTDIYRLFQGHSGGFSQVKPSSHRHSFHASPSQSWQPNVSVSEVKSRLRVGSVGAQSTRSLNGPVPLKGNHDIYNHVDQSGLPWDNSTGNKSLNQFKHNSLSDEDKLSTLV